MPTSPAQAPTARYVIARRSAGLPASYFLCQDPQRNRMLWSSRRRPVVVSHAQAIALAPRLKFIAGELFAKPVDAVRVDATHKGYEKKLGINVRIVELSRSNDLAYTELLTVVGHENAPDLGGIHFDFSQLLNRTK